MPAWALTGALVAAPRRHRPSAVSPAFLSYANQYTKPFNEISGVVTELQNALACAARLFELIEEAAADARTRKTHACWTDAEGRMTLEHVAFSYVPDRPLIEDSEPVAYSPGQRVAIVGPTGCGKTTLINLLMRFYDVDDGRHLGRRHRYPAASPARACAATTAWCFRIRG